MTSVYSYTISQRSTSTLDHLWDPYQVLGLERDNRCVGWAHTKGRKCLQIVNRGDKAIFHDIVSDMSSQPLDANELRPELRELASHGLCLQARHRRSQVDDMVAKWTRSLAHEQARSQQRLPRSGSTTESFATIQSPSIPAQRTTRSSSSTMSASSFSAQTEVECLRLSIAAMQATIDNALRRLESIESPNAPRIEPIHPLDRVSTTDISSVYLSTPSLTDSPTRSSESRTSTRSPSPTPSTSSRHSYTSSSDSSPPPTQRLRRTQPTATTTDSPMTPVSPPQRTPTHTPSPRCPIPHVRRLPLTSTSSCPICYESLTTPTSAHTSTTHPSSSNTAADAVTVWCKSSCGQSVHTSCMDAWRASCAAIGREARCTMCRARWEGGCGC
ncbi:hypothetical protein SVAN01_03273 [Stagonosporopsis vannaccii]|nr:hypothetical protein SVAN01_03273 [Stagonosporopsis vannaccii]